jgi:leader peptidase (prepilin peptidase)/N-methyltransferase
MIEAFLVLFAPFAGLVLGSLATTAALRAGRGEQGWAGRSHCDHCGTGLGYGETLPLVGFLQRGGRCAHCGGRIDPVHLAGELAGLAIGTGALIFGATPTALAWTAGGFALLGAVVFAARRTRRAA